MRSLDTFAAGKLHALEERALRRELLETTGGRGGVSRRGGRALVCFSGNDTLGLAHHPHVVTRAREALERYGAGAGASRLVTGNHPLYAALERALAEWRGTEAALVFGSGFLLNAGVIPALAGREDVVILDELAHASLHTGARLTRGAVLTFRHNDAEDLAVVLERERARHGRCLVVTEGVFSMDGDRAPLAALSDLAVAHDAWLLVDDAHGFGVLARGRGSVVAAEEESARALEVPLQVGTLSKAAGSYGGFLCASRVVVELLKSRARSLVYSTGLPPAVVAAGLAAVEVMAQEPERCERPLLLATRFCERTRLPAPASPVVPVVIGDARAALLASRQLEEEGFLVAAIRPPTVPEGTARLRLTFSAAHTDDDVDRLATVLRPLLSPAASGA